MELDLPKLSIVTPSFNQSQFLESAMVSVLDQRYPDLEYVVIDGGSTDDSKEIIQRRSAQLTFSSSEPDKGLYDALNKGFRHTSGDVMAWLNSDDMYVPGALSVVGEIFARFPQIEWLTSLFPLHWDVSGRAVRCWRQAGYSKTGFFRGENLPNQGWFAIGWIPQEATFWRRSLWDRSGGRLDDSLSLAGDFELWARFFRHAELYGVETPLAGFRWHGAQMSSQRYSGYVAEARAVLSRFGFRPRPRALSGLRRATSRLPERMASLVGAPGGPRCVFAGPQERWKIVA